MEQPDVRLLTLTGPGGTGKTGLAVQAAAEAAERFPDGAFWVPLAPLRDYKLVLETAAQALEAGRSLERAHRRQVGAPPVRQLRARHRRGWRPLRTARRLPEPRAAGDEPRATPRSGRAGVPGAPARARRRSRALLARARSALPSFVPDEAVPKLCSRLEQLPLALELAAARVRVISPELLLERLSGRLDLLKAGRAVDPRQQTLRATIEWSYELLDGDEQAHFARLAVFAGGCTLEAAEEVCDAHLDTLQSLVDKSLVRVRERDRFWMLEIREYPPSDSRRRSAPTR
jgi:predicted ATPase